jgi:hypothetical protein
MSKTPNHSGGELIETSKRNLSYVALIEAQVSGPVALDHEQMCGWVGSALFWLVAIDELLEGVSGTPFLGRGYKDLRNASSGGQTLRALRAVRNEVAHGVALPLRPHGLEFPLFTDGVADFGGGWVDLDVILESHVVRDRA